jgi:DNA ligase-1
MRLASSSGLSKCLKTYTMNDFCIQTLISGKNKGGRCSRKATVGDLCTQHHNKTVTDKFHSETINKQNIQIFQMDETSELFSSSNGVLLANNFFDKNNKARIDPTGWWMSEKYDGIRAIWTGKRLMSRTGKVITAPQSFLSLLPSDSSFDGELFTKRGAFSKTSSIVSKKIPLEFEWDDIIFQIFDIPHAKDTFENRIDIIDTLVKQINSPQIVSVKHTIIDSHDHLISLHHHITSSNGEGVMIRKPLSFYEPKRSNSLLKVKMFKDEDAIIIGYESGSGRLQNALGSLIVKWVKDSSVIFKVGTGLDDSIRFSDYNSILPIGSVISVKFFELDSSSGKPRFPVFLSSRFEQP